MKVIGVVFAGRKRYLEILAKYLLRANKNNMMDECYLCFNTRDPNDGAYINELEASRPDFFKIKRITLEDQQNRMYHKFYTFTTDPNTIYIKLDDDICWMEENTLAELVEFRKANPHPFLVSANIVNNWLGSHLHQRFGIFPAAPGRCGFDPFCGFGWRDGRSAEFAHNALLSRVNNQKLLDEYKFSQWKLTEYIRFSIGCICWFGKDMPAVESDDESFLSSKYPSIVKRPCTVCGTALVSHFAYFPQREYLETNTNLLERYRALSLLIKE